MKRSTKHSNRILLVAHFGFRIDVKSVEGGMLRSVADVLAAIGVFYWGREVEAKRNERLA